MREEIFTMKSNCGISPRCVLELHLAALKVHHQAKCFDDWAATKHRRLTLQEKNLSSAMRSCHAHWHLHDPMAPAFAITTKVKFVVAAAELDLVDGVADSGQIVEVAASWAVTAQKRGCTRIQHRHIMSFVTTSILKRHMSILQHGHRFSGRSWTFGSSWL